MAWYLFWRSRSSCVLFRCRILMWVVFSSQITFRSSRCASVQYRSVGWLRCGCFWGGDEWRGCSMFWAWVIVYAAQRCLRVWVRELVGWVCASFFPSRFCRTWLYAGAGAKLAAYKISDDVAACESGVRWAVAVWISFLRWWIWGSGVII